MLYEVICILQHCCFLERTAIISRLGLLAPTVAMVLSQHKSLVCLTIHLPRSTCPKTKSTTRCHSLGSNTCVRWLGVCPFHGGSLYDKSCAE